jgi:hypothetical protein
MMTIILCVTLDMLYSIDVDFGFELDGTLRQDLAGVGDGVAHIHSGYVYHHS